MKNADLLLIEPKKDDFSNLIAHTTAIKHIQQKRSHCGFFFIVLGNLSYQIVDAHGLYCMFHYTKLFPCGLL